MKGKRAIAAILCFLCGMLICSCTYSGAFEDMLSPPKLSEEQMKINQALVQSKGNSFILKYPKAGNYISAFVIEDFDSEPDNEAIVFYETAGISAQRIIWMNFMDTDAEGNWKSVYELPVNGTDIEKVYFSPLGDDSTTNIIVCYSVNQTEKAFVLMRYEQETPKVIFEDAYTFLEAADFFDTGSPNMMVIKNDRALETSSATIYTWHEGLFSHYGSALLDPTAAEYTGIICGKVNPVTNAVIIEHKKSYDSNCYGTDLIYKSGSRIFNAVYSEGMALNAQRTERTVSSLTEYAQPMDINGDGFIELCGTNEFPGYESAPGSEKAYMVTWKAFEYGVLKELYSTYYTAQYGYMFIIPNRWRSTVTAKLSDNNSRVIFESLSGEQLLSIKTVSDGELFAERDYSVYAQKGGRTYYIRKSEIQGVLALTDKEIGDCFNIM